VPSALGKEQNKVYLSLQKFAKNMSRIIIKTASIFLALAVIIGAFGAHGLKSHISAELLQTYKTGVEYHFYHALGLLLLGILAVSKPSKWIKWSAILLSTGIVLFSGSLYLMAVTGIVGWEPLLLLEELVLLVVGLCFL